MGLLDSIRASASQKAEKRVLGGAVWHPYDFWPSTFAQGGPGKPSQQGTYSSSVEGALANTALYAGTRLLAANAASLPVNVYVKSGKQRVPYDGPSLFDSSPSVSGSLNNWLFELLSNLILTGNSWGLVTGRDGFGYPTGIEWVPENQVIVTPDGDSPWNPLATKVYCYGREVSWYGPGSEVVHVKSFPLAGHLQGLSLIKAAALTLMQGRMTAEFAANFFKSGGQTHTIMRNSELEVDAEQSAAIRHQLSNVMLTGAPLVIGRDWEVVNAVVRADESQFLQTLRLNSTQIASLLGLPPEMLGGESAGMHYSSELMNQEAVVNALRPWLSVMESALSDWLPGNRSVKFNDRSMLRLDPVAQTQVWQIERDSGVKTADEIRAEIDLPPLPNGVGSVSVPGTVLNALARGMKASPKAYAAELDFEAEPAPEPAVPADGPENDVQPAEDDSAGDPVAAAAEAVRALLGSTRG